VVDPRDVTVWQKPTQLALETIDKIERGLRGLRRIPGVRMCRVDLVHGRHRLVRKAADVAETARLVDANAAGGMFNVQCSMLNAQCSMFTIHH
jgi:hypothetical protein